MRIFLRIALALLVLALSATGAQALEYPCTGTVRIIVALGAGSTTDVIARQVADRLAPEIGRTIIVENVSGADGALGARSAFQSAPDGCTLFAMTNGMIGIEPRLGPQEWDPTTFVPISMLARNYQVLVANPAIATDFGAFTSYVRSHPGTTYGRAVTSGLIACAYLAKKAGLAMTGVPYSKGGDPAMVPDLVSGRIASGCPFLGPIRPMIATGSARVLAILGPERFAQMPDIPAITEVLPGSEDLAALEGRSMLVCPPECPASVARILSPLLREMLAEPGIIERFRNMGAEAVFSSPEELHTYIRTQRDLFRNVIGQIGLEYKPN